jgi:hypothetical protein
MLGRFSAKALVAARENNISPGETNIAGEVGFECGLGPFGPEKLTPPVPPFSRSFDQVLLATVTFVNTTGRRDCHQHHLTVELLADGFSDLGDDHRTGFASVFISQIRAKFLRFRSDLGAA